LNDTSSEGRVGGDRPGPLADERGVRESWRSLLFVPGSRPDRYPKAFGSRADVVCVDLEDAVTPGQKDEARARVADLVGSSLWTSDRASVRVNRPGTGPGDRDLDALLAAAAAATGAPGLTIVLPKVGSPDQLADVRGRCRAAGVDGRLVAMIETAEGLEAASDLARAPGVIAVFLGAVDLAAELGCAIEWDALLYARSRVVHAAALGRVQAIDVPFLNLEDRAGLESETRAVARLGFKCKAAIHPVQVEPIHAAFAPSGAEVERAQGILDAYERAGGGVVAFDGMMVDRPVVEAARRTLERGRE
jgi:citrate lyase beta subunit